MDNLTHSLIGYALADLAGARAPRLEHEGLRRGQRQLFVWTSVLAANLPDADLFFTGFTPAPLGYLLHHRGHTHTVLGLVPQLAILLILLWACARPAGWHALGERTWAAAAVVGAAGLASHLLADAWNSYGIHPYHPFDSRWSYGDAVFILEPVIWVVLLAVVAASFETRWLRVAVVLIAGALCSVLASAGLVTTVQVVALAAVAALLAAMFHRWMPVRRAAAGLGLVVLFVLCAYGASGTARSRMLDALRREHPAETVHDLVLGPAPANPACWSVLSVSTSASSFHVRRASVSLWPWLVPAADCPFARLPGPGTGLRPVDARSDAGLLWMGEKTTALADLRTAYAASCALRAWWRFGRVPDVGPALVEDLRFAWGGRGNFTRLAWAAWPREHGCPEHVPGWTPPRAALLRH